MAVLTQAVLPSALVVRRAGVDGSIVLDGDRRFELLTIARYGKEPGTLFLLGEDQEDGRVVRGRVSDTDRVMVEVR